MTLSAKQIADIVHGEIVGNPDVEVNNFSKIESGKRGTLSFLANLKYKNYIYETESDIVLVNNDFVPEKPIKATLIKVSNAYMALTVLLDLASKSIGRKKGIEEMSFVSSSATLGEDLYLGAFAYIGDKARIGKNTQIYPHTFVGDNVKIGDNVIIYSGVRIYHDCEIGDNCIIHAGAVIGSDGFGFSPEDGVYNKIPQLGNVIIENDVEIGANTTIDRAVMESTIIHKGVKLDNLIHVAHNCEVGENSVMAAQVGIAGTTKIGKQCMLGGQVGLGGHITIGDNTQIGAQSGIIKNIKSGSQIIGTPAIPIKNFFKSNVIFAKLPEMYQQLNQMQKELEELKKNISEK